MRLSLDLALCHRLGRGRQRLRAQHHRRLVIGGISIAGGIGSVGGAVLGALFLGIISNALPVINISPFWQMAISGSAIILAVVLNARGERRQGRIILKKAEAA